MSYLSDAEFPHESASMSPNHGFLRTSPSPQPSQQQPHKVGMESSTNLDRFQDPESPSWPVSMSEGLGLRYLPTTTSAGYDMTTVADSLQNDTSMTFTWPSQLTSPQPHIIQPPPVRRDSCSDQSCDPRSIHLDGGQWDHRYDTSPGRSEYSRSSYPSAVSSPYAHSDLCVQRVDSPQIKIEYPLDPTIPQITFVSEDAHEEHQPLLVNPGDLMNTEHTSIEERLRKYLGSSSSSDNGDYKPHIQREDHRRAHSFGDFGSLSLSRQHKRKFKKPETGTHFCDRCGRSFQRASNLRAHLVNVEGQPERPHACTYDGCTNTFVRRADLTRHIESVHIKSRAHKCRLCGKDFPRKDTLTRHEEDGCPRRDKVRSRIGKPKSAQRRGRQTSEAAHAWTTAARFL